MLEVNKIYLGDSYELIKQIPDKSIDCIYTDIPYEIDHRGGGSSELAKRIGDQRDDLENNEIADGIDFSIFNDFTRVMKKINCFIWCSKLQILPIMEFFLKFENVSFEILTWHKLNPTPSCNGKWLPDTEYCFYFREKGATRLNDGYELKSKYYISALNKYDKDLFNHPTIKPLELVKRHILHTTQPNDVVLDCFSGSGTTCVAAMEEGRNFIGIEVLEKWHKISVDRINGITANGQTSIFTNFEDSL